MKAPKLELKISKQALLTAQQAGKDLKRYVTDTITETLAEGEKEDCPEPGFRLHSDADLLIKIEYALQSPDPDAWRPGGALDPR